MATTESNHELELEIKKLTAQLKLLTSKKQTFARGLITGIATALGATIIAGIFIAILGRVVNSVEDVPLLRDLIETINLKDLVDKK